MPVFPYAHVRSYTKEVLSDTPLSYWPLNDFSASTVARDLAALHNGVYTGDSVVRNQAGPGRGLSGAVSLGGTDDGVLIGDFAEYEFAGDFTAEIWFYPTAATDGYLIGKRVGSGGEWVLFFNGATGSSLLSFVTNTGGTAFLTATGGTVSLNAWHHAAMVLSGTTLTVYLDGVQAATSSATTGTRRTSSADSLAFGFNPNTTAEEFTGRLSSAAVYSSALSAARLQQRVLAVMI